MGDAWELVVRAPWWRFYEGLSHVDPNQSRSIVAAFLVVWKKTLGCGRVTTAFDNRCHCLNASVPASNRKLGLGVEDTCSGVRLIMRNRLGESGIFQRRLPPLSKSGLVHV